MRRVRHNRPAFPVSPLSPPRAVCVREREVYCLLGLRDRLDLRGKLESNLLVGDGALGPLLDDRDIEHPLDEAVLRHPQRIRDLHEEYLRGAGARTTDAYAVDPTGREHAPKYGVGVARRLLAVLQPFSSRGSISCPRPRCYASRGT